MFFRQLNRQLVKAPLYSVSFYQSVLRSSVNVGVEISYMYRVQLQNFEGPLDLLLFFIKRDELDIYDIPISHITNEFLDYIQLMDVLDLDVASEFIYMASLLMSIKAKMMLPRDEEEESDELDEDDPRYELVRKLLEYKRYKEMAEKMALLDEEARYVYPRGFIEEDEVEKQASGEALKDVTMFELMSAFRTVLSSIKKNRTYHRVEKVSHTVEEQSRYVLETLQKRGRQSFIDLCRSFTEPGRVVVTFLAVLEMIKEQQVDLYLSDTPTEFYLDLKPVDDIIHSALPAPH